MDMKILILTAYGLVYAHHRDLFGIEGKDTLQIISLPEKETAALKLEVACWLRSLEDLPFSEQPNLTMDQSWAAVWYLLSASFGLWLLIPLVKKVSRYGKFTIAEMIGRFYGETARKSASVHYSFGLDRYHRSPDCGSSKKYCSASLSFLMNMA
ncbi:MAG: hypothetical protein AB2L24_32055 [Mangrovibacterium sp.]